MGILRNPEELGMCGKTNFWSKTELSKNLTSVQFSDRNCMQSAIQLKVTKSNFTGIKCADKKS